MEKKRAQGSAALKILQNLAWRFTILKKFIEIYETYLGWPVHYTACSTDWASNTDGVNYITDFT